MESQEIFNTLEHDDNLSNARRTLIDFLKESLPSLKSEKQSAPAIAYEIAGMLASKFALSLSDDDPLMEIMTIAGELEVNPENAGELTQELIAKIEALSEQPN